ncbi:MAG: hypothetical protein QOH13_1023, partial [Thermoleophilaceae bacterium]|nr:hypothetical protein [Thermoleophilaceae bacterium]
MARAKAKPELPVIHFAAPGDWEKWLGDHHGESPGVWMKIAK